MFVAICCFQRCCANVALLTLFDVVLAGCSSLRVICPTLDMCTGTAGLQPTRRKHWELQQRPSGSPHTLQCVEAACSLHVTHSCAVLPPWA